MTNYKTGDVYLFLKYNTYNTIYIIKYNIFEF